MAGGGAGGVLGAAIAAVLNHYNVHLSDIDAAIIGSVALAAGAGLGHVIAKVGISGAFVQLWKGAR